MLVAFALAAAGVVAAAALERPPSPDDRAAPTVRPSRAPVSSPEPTTPPTSEPSPEPEASPEPSPTPDPYALADGTYPTFIREVDPSRATITVDVIQVFKDEAARVAAIQDGVPRRDARYLYLYVRNENDLLRTLPVARDVGIRLIGGCEAPNRHLLLKKLSREVTPYTEDFYYAVRLTAGEVDRVVQHLAIVAC
jgi:hypothetical protein